MTIAMYKSGKQPKPDYRVVLWSGGKDSTATIIRAHERGEKIDQRLKEAESIE